MKVYEKLDELPMQYQEFYIDVEGRKLHAKVDVPQGAGGKVPLLILVHGLTGHMEERHIIAVQEVACEVGFGVLRVEMYGHGQSEGRFYDHTVWKWVCQLLSVIDRAREIPWATNLYLSGHSQGGLTTMLVGAMKRDQLKAIIPLSPAICIWDGARKGEMLGVRFDPNHVPDEVPLNPEEGKFLDGNYLRSAQLLPVEEAIRDYDGPVLISHGTADEAVPFWYAQDAVGKYAHATLVEIPGDTHCYDHSLELGTQAVARFLREQEGMQ